MVHVRPFRVDDEAAVRRIDTSFTTDRIVRIAATPSGFTVGVEAVEPLHKRYVLEELRGDHVVVAVGPDDRVLGVAVAELVAWNRRVGLNHLYVDRGARGAGVGRALVASVVAFAAEAGARCVHVETQDVNAPAVGFYRRLGFELCGFDRSLYDPERLGREEVALFLSRATASSGSRPGVGGAP